MTTFLQATYRLVLRRAESQAASVASSCPSFSSLLSRSKPDDIPELRQLLHHCISMVPYLTPSEPAIAYPFLTHPDLSRINIIVRSSEAANVVSCIDWQGSTATLYLMGPDLPPAIRYASSLVNSRMISSVFQRYPQIFHQNSKTRLILNGDSLNGTERSQAFCYETSRCVVQPHMYTVLMLRTLPDTALRSMLTARTVCVISFLRCIKNGLLSWKVQRPLLSVPSS